MGIIRLADLQRAAQQRAAQRDGLRHFLIGRDPASASTYRLESRRLYADGPIDNLGLTDTWLAGASEGATLFSQIATALLGD